MKALLRFIFAAWTFGCMLGWMGCRPENVAGGGGNGSETTNGITARLLQPNGSPAQGVAIKLRPADFLVGDSPGPGIGKARRIVDTITDARGAFTIPDLMAGQYVIEAQVDTTLGWTSPVRISGENAVADLGDARLGRNGLLTGRVDRGRLGDSVGIIVRLYGLERKAACGPDGGFRLLLAPGTYALKVGATSHPDAGSLEIPQVTCLPGTETRLADLSLPMEYQADSLEVRAFLEASGLIDAGVDWAKTIGVENNRIRSLNLKGLGLTSLHPAIGRLDFLYSLNLDGNPLKDLPGDLDGLGNLMTLSLERVPLDSLPPVVSRMPALRNLLLGKTGLKDLPESLANLSRLNLLKLDSNGMTRVPSVVSRLTELYDLDLAWNRLRTIPPDIGNLASLRNLSIADNVMDSLPAEIGRLGNLIRLWAFHNRIQKLPTSLSGLSSLEVLHLETNLLDSLPPEVGDLGKLKLLALGDNKLAALPERLTRLRPVDGLSLWNNRLCDVPEPIRAWIDQYDFERMGQREGNLWAGLQAGCAPAPAPIP